LALPEVDQVVPAGRGGAAQVFRARDGRTGASLALKVASGVEGRRALAREAVYAGLRLSPRLPEIVGLGWIPGATLGPEHASAAPRACLALRWRDGESLARAPRPGAPARTAHALGVAADVGEALADLHGFGLAHGDLKPDNLIVDAHGRVHLIDLGLAAPALARTITGGTPRYLPLDDVDPGDACARDRLALGAVLAELVDDDVAAAERPIGAARGATILGPVGAIVAALVAPSPGARPSAWWAAERARAELVAMGARRASDPGEGSERQARRVRASYLRLRRVEIEAAASARAGTAPWLSDAIELVARARSLEGDGAASDPAGSLGPLPPEGVARWLTMLVGPAAASWPLRVLTGASEAELARALEELARRTPPSAWRLADVEIALRGDAPTRAAARAAVSASGPIDADRAAALALALARVPADAAAIADVEAASDAPGSLMLAAADALRLGAELGRARSLVLRVATGEPRADALAADVLRRSGDIALARARATAAIAYGDDSADRARATLARIAIDAGDLDEAARTLDEGGSSAPLCEARALLTSMRGATQAALEEVVRGEALAISAEERARLRAMRGFLLHEDDPAGALRAYAAAVEDAVRAGATLEEATYRTGEAAAAVAVGDLGAAILSGRRAALLWEHLGRPAHAARARLAVAAAYATAGATHETEIAARDAIACARDAADRRAEAYALWAIADAGAPSAAEAARDAAALVDPDDPSDALRAAARVLERSPADLPAPRIDALDRLAEDPSSHVAARLEWWGARARRLVRDHEAGAPGRPELPLAALASLATARAPIGSRGPALAAGVELAASAGRGELARRLLAALADAARDLGSRAPPELADAIAALPWVARAAVAPDAGLRPEQARDLERLLGSFAERERLSSLLARVVDALVLWTGVERGLLLLRAPDGRLVPRAARNLARADLRGEQLALSQTLAARALEAREPVVAVDASGELSTVHASVHALRLRSVLAVPLVARGEALGVVYLDDRVRRGAFGPGELTFTRAVASLAAIAIADTRDQVLLRRAARRAARATDALRDALAHREAALDAAERELARVRDGRSTRFRYDRIVGESESLCAMLRVVDRVTTADVPVLLLGESGSGKELVARAIHDNGPRSRHAFVGENCGAIPEPLLESALFGHVRGAFTGADRPRAGLFEVADRGTLFLDEVGEMSLGMQAKLLRVLEDGFVRPVGSERGRHVDVRVVAATHRDLTAMVAARTFREDLLYRLDIVTIRVPPLRERAADVPLLVQRFLKTHAPSARVRVTPAAMERLVAYPWPGNVRQLENEIRRAIILSDGTIDREHLSPDVAGVSRTTQADPGLHLRSRLDALEADLVREALRRTGHNQTRAAKLLGVSRFGIQKMIKRLAIG
jgi:transcriptional regulator with GAF, ATPase, and Fis domain